jgi:hypothetical protein
MPVMKEPGARVIGGTLNAQGGIVMRAEKVGRDTMLARIVQMVAEAQRSRAPIQRLADLVSAWFVPLVVVVALIAFAAWALFGPEPRFAYGLVAAVSVLIIACPCAWPATERSWSAPTRRPDRRVDRARIAGAPGARRYLVIDKTGTLTEGNRWSPSRRGFSAMTRRAGRSLEQSSEHPLAAAILRAARERGLTLAKADLPSPNGNVTGTVENRPVALGNRVLRSSLARHRFACGHRRRATGEATAFPNGRWHAGRRHRHRRSDQSHHRRSGARVAGRGHSSRHADRRQPHLGASGGAQARHRRSRSRGAARAEERRGEAAARRGPHHRHDRRRGERRAARSPPPRSASPWAPAPTWRWKAPA